jgi:nitroreductase
LLGRLLCYGTVGIETPFTTHRRATSVSGLDCLRFDVDIAGEHLVLASTELGLGTCWIGWIRARVLARIVGWPRSVKPAVVITVGFPASRRETVPPRASTRKPLAELVSWL